MRSGKPTGFTLLELMFVLAIMGILAAIVIPRDVYDRYASLLLRVADVNAHHSAAALQDVEPDGNGK